MVMWAAIVGAMLGWIICEFAGYGLLLGVIPGAVVGLILFWAAAIAIHLRLLMNADRDERVRDTARIATRAGHVGTAWLAIAIVVDTVWLVIDRVGLAGTGWKDASLSAVLALALIPDQMGDPATCGTHAHPVAARRSRG